MGADPTLQHPQSLMRHGQETKAFQLFRRRASLSASPPRPRTCTLFLSECSLLCVSFSSPEQFLFILRASAQILFPLSLSKLNYIFYKCVCVLAILKQAAHRSPLENINCPIGTVQAWLESLQCLAAFFYIYHSGLTFIVSITELPK